MKPVSCLRLILIACIAGLLSCSETVPESHISEITLSQEKQTREIERFPQKKALFGDLHVHTSWSMDAYAGGNRLGPATAYRFARGEQVELPNGVIAQLHAPLDFVALTDHAEGFSTHLVCTVPGAPEFDTETCDNVRNGLDQDEMLRQAFETAGTRPGPRNAALCEDIDRCMENARSTWQQVQDLANAYDDPGEFTALIGYEFSSLLVDFGMLHRNVIFRGRDVIPHAISSQDVINQKDFFNQLDEACEAPCEVLTIPHNTNFSWGLTFSRTDEDGSEYTAEDLQKRARIDRLFEITQQKGNSECTLGVGASDEDCNFGNLFPPCENGQTTRCIHPTSMYRNALLEGLSLEDENGFNPYRIGVIGSTDTHNSDPGYTTSMEQRFSSFEEWSFFANRLFDLDHQVIGPIRKLGAGGLAAVWAETNTREDIYDALQRREAFATSGSRLKIRFFAGDLPPDIATTPAPVEAAYKTGVPMGGEISAASAPTFWVRAMQDPASLPLDRIQVIKGWTDDGTQKHRVWDVACSSGRTPNENDVCPPTQASVNLENCEASGTPGAGQLQATFSDPGFVIGESAFYYVRVLEDPRCHWTKDLANRADVEPPADVPALVQERGWSSPIWLTP